MPHPENLKPFTGKDDPRRNKKGPFKRAQLNELLDQVKPEDYEKVVAKLVQLAGKGNTRAIELLLDRWAGKVTQPVEVSGVAIKILPKSKRTES